MLQAQQHNNNNSADTVSVQPARALRLLLGACEYSTTLTTCRRLSSSLRVEQAGVVVQHGVDGTRGS